MRPVGRLRIPSLLTVVVGEDNPAQDPPIIHARHAVAFEGTKLQPSHLLFNQLI